MAMEMDYPLLERRLHLLGSAQETQIGSCYSYPLTGPMAALSCWLKSGEATQPRFEPWSPMEPRLRRCRSFLPAVLAAGGLNSTAKLSWSGFCILSAKF